MAAATSADEGPARDRLWLRIWEAKRTEVAIIVAALAALTGIFFFQTFATKNERVFRIIRLSYLAFTLVFIGWYANAQLSVVNLAARQRMLSQRMVLQTVLAARGSDLHLKAARSSLTLFTDSQARLVDTPRHLDATSAEIIRKAYHGPQGVGATIDAFAQQVGTALDLAERQSPRVEDALARLVEEVRHDDPMVGKSYDRTHNRHNR